MKISERWAELRKRISKKNETRFLKKHGVSSWKQYDLKYDPDYNARADSIRRMYHGYPYIAEISKAGALAKPANNVVADGFVYLRDWLASDCRGKTRVTIERTDACTVTKLDGTVIQDWYFNEICGNDTVFVAFKDERDYLMFLLKWETG